MKVELTILMPCLNEERTIATCIRKAWNFIERNSINAEIVIADNGSVDASRQIAEDLGARVICVEKKGYGAALLAGIREARGQFVVMGDSDDSYDFFRLDAFLTELRAGKDLVMGDRFAGGIGKGAMPLLHKYLGNPVLSYLGRLFYGIPVRDFHCGLRGFNREKILALGLTCEGMEFASEMVVKSACAGLQIGEVPTVLSVDGRDREPHLRSWRDGWRHLRFLLLMSPRWLFLYPSLTLCLAGLIILLSLLSGPVFIGSVGFDIHTMLFGAAFLVIGFQALVFALLARYLAVKYQLLGESPLLSYIAKKVTLERGIVLGTVLMGLGILYSMAIVADWSGGSFGTLDPSEYMRRVIPAVTLAILGGQTMISSFFVGVLGFFLRGR